MRKLLMDHRCNELGGSLESFMLSGGEKIDIHGSRIIIYGPDELRPWTGEGLPPVGTVCEVENRDQDGRWSECTILAWDSECAVFVARGDYPFMYDGNAHPGSFRPIRTPEQIAAEEKSRIINQMVTDSGWTINGCPSQWVAAFEALHLAGYRKFEITDEA